LHGKNIKSGVIQDGKSGVVKDIKSGVIKDAKSGVVTCGQQQTQVQGN
jgi:hypothetical protein